MSNNTPESRRFKEAELDQMDSEKLPRCNPFVAFFLLSLLVLGYLFLWLKIFGG